MTAYTFDQIFDFTRTTAGTFVGSNGLIQNTPASVNLLTQTQQFDNAAWTKGAGVTVTANADVAPDGTSTADIVAFSTGGASQFIRGFATLTVGVVYTYSVYARLISGTPTFTLDAGNASVSTAQTPTSSWQRFSFTFTFSGANQWVDLEATAAGAIAFWGAQLEVGSTATTYTRNNGGLFPARFDYDPVTLLPRGLLVEEQRTNLIIRSEDFTTGWANTSLTVTANSTVAPDGTTTADTLTSSGSPSGVTAQSITFTGDGTKSVSVFLKAGTSTSSVFFLRDVIASTTRGSAAITWSGGVPTAVASFGGTIEAVENFGNGWYRIELICTGVIAANTHNLRIQPDNVVGTDSVIAWGAQAENGAFATSYIPTVASQVTRTADVCTITAPMFAPWYNQSAGTFVADADAINFGVVRRNIQVDDGTGNERMYLGTNTSTNPYAVVVDGGVTQADMSATGTVSANTPYKITLAYAANDFALCGNGGAVTTDAAGTLPSPTLLRIGSSESSVFLNGHIRSVKFYPFRASNTQLQALTT